MLLAELAMLAFAFTGHPSGIFSYFNLLQNFEGIVFRRVDSDLYNWTWSSVGRGQWFSNCVFEAEYRPHSQCEKGSIIKKRI